MLLDHKSGTLFAAWGISAADLSGSNQGNENGSRTEAICLGKRRRCTVNSMLIKVRGGITTCFIDIEPGGHLAANGKTPWPQGSRMLLQFVGVESRLMFAPKVAIALPAAGSTF